MLAVLGYTTVCFCMTILQLLSIHPPSDLDASPPQPSDLQFQFLHLQLQHLLLCDELLFLSRQRLHPDTGQLSIRQGGVVVVVVTWESRVYHWGCHCLPKAWRHTVSSVFCGFEDSGIHTHTFLDNLLCQCDISLTRIREPCEDDDSSALCITIDDICLLDVGYD